ncbi:MAG: IS1595 family transposase [Clostridia bacterium]|nr:IS1595 family transposase [Clostridia bacterium]
MHLQAEEERQYICEDSPYSKVITSTFGSYAEFSHCHSLRLQEAVVTRPALIREINWDLFVTSEGKTNRELVEDGGSPYAEDKAEGLIELHHLGQRFESPFAELTMIEHMRGGNNKRIHLNEGKSWREDEEKVSAFASERQKYWRLRLAGEYSLAPTISFTVLPNRNVYGNNEFSEQVRSAVEALFMECNEEDLVYLRDTAQNYAIIKHTGARTIGEFVGLDTMNNVATLRCPRCESSKISCNGHYKKDDQDIQRYLCTNCRKTFSATHGSILAGSDLSLMDWLKFIHCFYNGYSLEKTAKLCNLEKKSAYNNRLKLFYALKLLDENVKLTGNVVVDETYVPNSLKGNHDKNPNHKQPRASHKRGHEDHTPGTSKEKVCIACALDEDGNSIAHVAGLGSPSAALLEEAYRGVITPKDISCLYSDKAKATLKYATDNNIPIKQETMIRKNKNGVYAYRENITPERYEVNRYLERINAYHSRLKRFLAGFSGVSTKNLAGYMYLFSWKERNKGRDIAEVYQELLEIMLRPQLHLSEDELQNGVCFPDPIQQAQRVGKIKDMKKASNIYELYAQGVPVKVIAQRFNMSQEGIYKQLRKYRKLGYAYETPKERISNGYVYTGPNVFDALLDETRELLGIGSQVNKRREEMYATKQVWPGTVKSFVQTMAKKYNISRQTVKNNLSKQNVIEQLKVPVHAYEEYPVESTADTYRRIYNRYLELKAQHPDSYKYELVEMLATETDYAEVTLRGIIKEMESPGAQTSSATKTRVSPKETANRNKALFVDYMNWKGTKEEFYNFTKEKYKIGKQMTDDILKLMVLSDPKRKELL